MRATPAALLAMTLVLAAGCQETGSSIESSSSASAGATSSAAAPAESPAATSAPAAGSGELMKTDKTMELAVPGGGMATLRYADLKVGDGSIAGPGKVAMVHYTGWLTDGTKFDSSLDRGQPFQFKIGEVPPMVIEGWDQGVRGMRVGGKRKLVVPSELGYGPRGYPPVIPPSATLVFDVELLGIQ